MVGGRLLVYNSIIDPKEVLALPRLWQIVVYYVQSLAAHFTTEGSLVLLAVGALMTWQYLRAQRMEVALFGTARHSLVKRLVLSVFFGVVGGLVGSLLLTGIGIAISSQWVGAVMVCSLLLALVDMRFICFAYSGGLLAVSYLLFGWPAVDVASLLGLVAVLHMVESVLMLLSGHLVASPVYVRREDGRFVGGYNLQIFWPLPLLALMFLPQAIHGVGGSIDMPTWWPLIRPVGAPLTGGFTMLMIPLLAALGYGDLAVTAKPRQKVASSAFRLLLFAATLLFLAWLGNRQPIWLWAAAIFAPIGHELLIVIGNWQEQTGQPLWEHQGPGSMVMEVLPGGSAARVGLRPRDVILATNDIPVENNAALQEQLAEPVDLQLTVERARGRQSVILLPAGRVSHLGLLLVPDSSTENYVETRFRSPLLWFWRLWQKR